MPKIPTLKSREVEHILERAGFVFIRQKGSHRMYIQGTRAVVLPWHTKDLRKGTLSNIITRSGLSVEEFLNLR
ncbi:MAG TPA: hypothetical protein DCY49_03200 [Candidatus Jacksonbacteria bacterium]|nr:MAG: hypothetical protein A2986_01060 [Candidatus Jacksonbacteria bacterium RIFCSPLOWO2_01_FULL_44_13]HAZ16883.1 hypothetical protein [Candidatus Jacksonbacteria bacterium]